MEWIGEEEKKAVLEVVEGGYLGRYGPEDDPKFLAKVYQLEQEFAQRCGVRYAVAVNSGTSALLAALAALGVGPGDEVIVPGYTFIASISSVVFSRAVPVLAEVDKTLNLDPRDVESKVTPRTRAILAVHMLGNPARLEELKAIADRHGLLLVEDCCQAAGATYRGKPVGSVGAAGCFSFNVYKTITAGDGGLMVTDDEETYRRAFAFHDQGHSPHRKGVEVGRRPFIGLDFRMTELTAAVVLAQLAKMERIVARLRDTKRALKSALADLPGLEFREITDPEGEIATLLTIFLPDEASARAVAAALGTKVVADSGWHVYSNMEHVLEKRTATPQGCPFNCSSHPTSVKYRKGMLPQTDALLARAINLSVGVSDPGLGSAFGATIHSDRGEVERVAAQVREVVARVVGK
jgi:dTDP-4-amino-4,6-dideoxygalactose transaminase